MNVVALVVLGLFLILPGFALSRLSNAWPFIAAAMGLSSVLVFFLYRIDKRRAENGQWRISETTLQLGALLGGWPGAFLGQRVFRHKTAKVSFQCVFWFIVLVHQLVALDYLLGWRMLQSVAQSLKP